MAGRRLVKSARYKSAVKDQGQRFTKEGTTMNPPLLNLSPNQGKNYIFEFDEFSDRDACRDFVASAIIS
ncbi:unnamed protein product [Cuscuta campestris]|uniref:Uncharacterized protein n=1 Tax=Cuscuta campestris TaxID=132261 RepID=A0A484NA29_9ASTE|nr:unnamed protein product [Cuscuta campestris]